MSRENYTESKSQKSKQTLISDQRENPGNYRSGRRDNRLPEEPKPRLPETTRAFIQHAFASPDVAEKLDQRRRWILVRYVADDKLTLAELRKYAGVKSVERVRQLYYSALRVIYQASPAEVRQKFPEKEVIKGKKSIYERTPTVRAKTKAALGAPEVKAKICAANRRRKGERRSAETREKMHESQKERRRREKQN
jgi:hypothetical protein